MNAGTVIIGRDSGMPDYALKLYVTGGTARSSRAIANLRRICGELLPGQCELVIVDVLEEPEAADRDRVLVTPTLIRQLPLPPRRVLGDLSDAQRVLAGLDLQPRLAGTADPSTGDPSTGDPSTGDPSTGDPSTAASPPAPPTS